MHPAEPFRVHRGAFALVPAREYGTCTNELVLHMDKNGLRESLRGHELLCERCRPISLLAGQLSSSTIALTAVH